MPCLLFIGKINGFRIDFGEDVIAETPERRMRVIELHSILASSRRLMPANKDRKRPGFLTFIEPQMKLLRFGLGNIGFDILKHIRQIFLYRSEII